MSLFDLPKPYLNPAVWNKNETIKPEVKDHILQLLAQIFPLNKTYQLVMIGSSVGHQYSEDSDIDVNVTARKGEDFDTWHTIFKKFNETPNFLPGTQHPINFFFQEFNESNDWSNSLGAYNLMTETWEKRPIPFEKLGNPEEKYAREIAYGKILLSMIDSETSLIRASRSRGDLADEQRRMYNLAILFKTIEDNRKAAYRYGTGTPALQEHNIVYKMIEGSPHKLLFHQLINLYDQNWKLDRVQSAE